ncbi:MAG: YhfC family intramembrane metalloprotease [Anaerolineaceae bacterium]|nr:YhfC family intramembrane metalloprotease [Anaerolineaceae bacterium]
MNEYIFQLLISILLCFSIPIILFYFLRKRWRISWIFFLIGAGSFIFSQIIHLPLNNFLGKINWIADLQIATGSDLIRTAIILGLTAGICEELTRWLILFIIEKVNHKKSSGLSAIALGIGHGGIEAIILGAIFVGANITTVLFLKLNDPSLLQIDVAQWQLIQDHYLPIINLPGGGFLPFVERMLAIILHVSLSVWVWRSYSKKKPIILLAAILYHTIVDMVLVLIIVWGINYWFAETLFLLMILPAPIIAYQWLKQESFWHLPVAKRSKGNFAIVLRHEIFYLRKSHKIWLIPLVFILIALVSVITAFFLPEIFKSIEEMQQYAALIPDPTIADAITQYVKNFSQFGFILVILIGMSAVSNEKEKGTAALFLSKPISRSSFILAKSLSLMLLIGISFLLSTIIAYFYIIILFGEIPFHHLLIINLNLFLWILPLIGLTILGSTIGKSTSSSAGIALALCVLLFILSAIPLTQGLFPGALLANISDYNIFLDLHPIQWWNPSAMLMVIAIFVLSQLLAIGLLEKQELD